MDDRREVREGAVRARQVTKVESRRERLRDCSLVRALGLCTMAIVADGRDRGGGRVVLVGPGSQVLEYSNWKDD